MRGKKWDASSKKCQANQSIQTVRDIAPKEILSEDMMKKTFEINGTVHTVENCMATAECDNEPQEALRVTYAIESGETFMYNVFGWEMPDTNEDFAEMCEDYYAWEVIEQG